MTGTAFSMADPGTILETFNLTGQGTMTLSFVGNPMLSQVVDMRFARISFDAPSTGNGGPGRQHSLEAITRLQVLQTSREN
jgi:hypothetical protein